MPGAVGRPADACLEHRLRPMREGIALSVSIGSEKGYSSPAGARLGRIYRRRTPDHGQLLIAIAQQLLGCVAPCLNRHDSVMCGREREPGHEAALPWRENDAVVVA